MSNFFTDYVDYASEFTDAPKIFHEVQSWVAVSTILGSRIWYSFGYKKLFSNIWCLLLANSSGFHKSTAIHICRDIVSHVQPRYCLPTEFTTEKLVEILGQQPVGLFTIDEFAGFMQSFDKEYNKGAKSFLTALYDSPVYRRATRAGDTTLNDVCLNMNCASTISWLVGAIKETDIEGGFLPRILLVPAFKKEKTISLPPAADMIKKNALIQQLHDIEQLTPGPCDFTAVAGEYDKWYKDYTRRYLQGSMMDAFYHRLCSYTLKLAMIYNAVMFSDKDIKDESIYYSIDRVEWLATMLSVLGEDELVMSGSAKYRMKVWRVIRSSIEGVSREYLLRATHMGVRELDAHIDTLTQQGRIVVVRETGTKGRPKVCYKMTDDEALTEEKRGKENA